MEIKIRKAKKEDSTKIYHLGAKIHELDFSKNYHFHELSEIKEFIAHPNENILFVAEEKEEKGSEKELIGFIYAKLLSHHAGGWCMLDNLGVLHHYRKHGVGHLLLKALYSELRKRKIWYVQVLEEMHHKETRKFWKKMGYAETKTFIWAEKRI